MSLLTNLEAYYTLDGHSTDYTFNGHNGLDTSVTYAAAKINAGAETLVTSSGIRFPKVVVLGSVFTIRMWLKPKASPFNQGARTAYGGVVTQDSSQGFFLHQVGSGTLTLELWVGGLQNSLTLTEGAGFWLVVTSDGVNVKIYKDNVLAATVPVVPSWSIASLLADNGGGNSCAAVVDEVAMWSREITALERAALDNSGAGISYDTFGTVSAPPSDTTAPTITNISPALLSDLSANTYLSFDLQDNATLRRVVIMAKFPDGSSVAIHDGDSFYPRFSGSSRTAIAGGFHFTVLPNGGWSQAPTLRIIAYDSAGNELT